MTLSVVVLSGGESRRMGVPKAWLPFGPERLLQRTVRRLAEWLAAQGQPDAPLVVVAAQGQSLPSLPDEVRVVRDREPRQGPLEGLRRGLEAAGEADAQLALVTACDLPLLTPEFCNRLLPGTDDSRQAWVPQVAGGLIPLPAIYRTQVAAVAEQCLRQGRGSLRFVLKRLATAAVEPHQLASVDPQLDSLLNCNVPADYYRALAIAGFSIDWAALRTLGWKE